MGLVRKGQAGVAGAALACDGEGKAAVLARDEKGGATALASGGEEGGIGKEGGTGRKWEE